MEHRLKKRCCLSMDVLVRGGNNLALPGKIRDLSTDGMFVQLASKIVPTNTLLDIEFPRGLCLNGWVVHAGDEGIGVTFRSISRRERILIEQLLAEKPAAQQK